MSKTEELRRIASQVRRDIIRMVHSAKSGHPGGSLSSTEIMTALYFNVMKHNPSDWRRDARGYDAFILSAGHLAPVYYSVLARSGYFDIKELGTLRQFGSRLQGHPCTEKGLPGVFQPSGSLGQGLSAAAGIALAKKMDKDGNRVYVLLGDGECEEGQIWEAAMFAANHGLDNLIAVMDWNNQQIDGKVSDVAGVKDYEPIWKAFGWETIVCDAHDFDSLLGAFDKAKAAGRPAIILAKSNMGQGVDFMCGTHKWHGKAPSDEQAAAALAQLEETLGDY